MIVAPASPEDLVERVDLIRLDASRRLEPQARAALGQFMTPAPVARILAHMFAAQRSSLRILDPGVGIGSLSAALVSELLARQDHPERIAVTAYEIDPMLTEYLSDTLELCKAASRRCGVDFSWTIEKEDFIASGVDMLQGRLFGREREEYDCAILNPPYRKINTESITRKLLREISEDLPSAEISRLLGCSDAAARQLISRGLDSLRRQMENKE